MPATNSVTNPIIHRFISSLLPVRYVDIGQDTRARTIVERAFEADPAAAGFAATISAAKIRSRLLISSSFSEGGRRLAILVAAPADD
jgi:hypothetical protein